jgi:hypothetical protein
MPFAVLKLSKAPQRSLPVAYSHGGFAQMRQLAVRLTLIAWPVPSVADTLPSPFPNTALDGVCWMFRRAMMARIGGATFSALESATTIFRKATR